MTVLPTNKERRVSNAPVDSLATSTGAEDISKTSCHDSTEMLTVEIDGANRVIGDHSIWMTPNGSFFDHNGSVYYKDMDHLLSERPDLMTHGERPIPTEINKKSKSAAFKKVTEVAQDMKRNIMEATVILDSYLPFYNFGRIQGNIGTNYNGQLAVFMWTPTLSGVKRGMHYSSVQYRTDDIKHKWKYVKGSDSKTVESMVPYDAPVYVTFGMGDFLLLKSTGLNYMCFGGDGAIKNTHYADYIREKIGLRTVRVIQDNDPSGESVIQGMKDIGLKKVESFIWKPNAKPKMDLRDMGHMIKSMGGYMPNLLKVITDGGRYAKQY